MKPLNIAVIGSGISGLSAAWLLSQNHNVTLLESDERIGGHTHTVDMDINGQIVPVDTGFICFNEATYPNLTALFKHLDVPVHDTNMGFAASLANGAYEYAGGTYFGMIGQLSNVAKPRHWRMIKDILRFFREAPKDLPNLDDTETLEAYLKRCNYGDEFIDHHLLPMAAAIWSSKLDDMTSYPARSFIRFFLNHGLLQVEGRPMWGTVIGGSRTYVEKMLASSNIQVETGNGAVSVERNPHQAIVHTTRGETRSFDHVVVASHADQALAMLADPSAAEQNLLGAFQYARNEAVLHRDRKLMPKRKLTWASWNYIDYAPSLYHPRGANRDLCVTYWMNSLQKLPVKDNVFVTLNPPQDMQIDNVTARIDYMHPVFDPAAMQAQRELWSLQGVNRTWYCGAHFGAGFHEDGLQSGLAVAEQLGGIRRPWDVENESGRIHISHMSEALEAAE